MATNPLRLTPQIGCSALCCGHADITPAYCRNQPRTAKKRGNEDKVKVWPPIGFLAFNSRKPWAAWTSKARAGQPGRHPQQDISPDLRIRTLEAKRGSKSTPSTYKKEGTDNGHVYGGINSIAVMVRASSDVPFANFVIAQYLLPPSASNTTHQQKALGAAPAYALIGHSYFLNEPDARCLLLPFQDYGAWEHRATRRPMLGTPRFCGLNSI